MPELPEVETIVRELRTSAKGKVLSKIECILNSVCKFDPALAIDDMNLRVLDVIRRGKFIVMVLEKDLKIIVHLRMTGRLMWHVEKEREKYVRTVFHFIDGDRLFFSDVRKFGKVWFLKAEDFELLTGIGRLGKEPFDMGYEEFMDLFYRDYNGARKKGYLKNYLLRQDFVAGIGNIYADEICYRSGLHPASRIEKIPKYKFRHLYDNIQICMQEGIKNCGVSMSDFVGTKGDLGRHQKYLKIYGRAGEKCYCCESEVVKIRTAGRGTHVCLKCQVRK